MSVTSPFKKAVSDHLQGLADKDPLFAETLKKPAKNIDECLNYILSEVKKSGHNGFSDEEVFAMAVHYYDEDSIKNIKPVNARVIVNQSMPADKKAVPAQTANSVAPAIKKPVAKKSSVPESQASLTF